MSITSAYLLNHSKLKYYFVTREGGLYSEDKKTHVIRQINPKLTWDGYYEVSIPQQGSTKRQFIRLHRLIAKIFIYNYENKPEVNHINGIKTDNRAHNLEWSTTSENMKHCFSSGLHPQIYSVKWRHITGITYIGCVEHLVRDYSEHNLIAQNLGQVRLGHRKSHKGWCLCQ